MGAPVNSGAGGDVYKPSFCARRCCEGRESA
jgi:hypothetical protein